MTISIYKISQIYQQPERQNKFIIRNHKNVILAKATQKFFHAVFLQSVLLVTNKIRDVALWTYFSKAPLFFRFVSHLEFLKLTICPTYKVKPL